MVETEYSKSVMGLQEVVAVDELDEGKSILFSIKIGESLREGFLIKHNDEIYAYLNICPHADVPIASEQKGAFTADKRYLICRTHWAMFHPETGVCVSGPCPIADLTRLKVVVDNDIIFVGA
ncbi:MAG: Rieske (2Fe-2S) protein [Chloroherpetonaceae bacterium]|nr:Rieske (2Fe-2S) protein [Chloroherpetonaceae bacterium]